MSKPNSEMFNHHGDKFWFQLQLHKSKIIPVKPHVAKSITESIIAILQVSLGIYHLWSLNIMICHHELIVPGAITLLEECNTRNAKEGWRSKLWKSSRRLAFNSPDERDHQCTPLHAGTLNAKLLRLSSNRRARNPYAAKIMCFKGSSGTCIKVCTSDLLKEMISQLGREMLVG